MRITRFKIFLILCFINYYSGVFAALIAPKAEPLELDFAEITTDFALELNPNRLNDTPQVSPIQETLNIEKTLNALILSYYPNWTVRNLSSNPHVDKTILTVITRKPLTQLGISRHDLLSKIFLSINKKTNHNKFDFIIKESNNQIFIIDKETR